MLYNMCARYVYCYDYVIEADNYEEAESIAYDMAEKDCVENYNFETIMIDGYRIKEQGD